jgi:hypothetical protein
MPLGPSTRTSLASAAVGATSATRFAAPAVTFSITNSTSDRVFPYPRPASSSQINQSSPAGGSWFGRAKIDQPSNSTASSAARLVRFGGIEKSLAPFMAELHQLPGSTLPAPRRAQWCSVICRQ